MATAEGRYRFKVRWRPYLLRPNTPLEGVPYKPGCVNPDRLRSLEDAGRAVGVEFTQKRERTPNTIPVHLLIEHSARYDQGTNVQSDLVERLFKMFFTDGVFLSKDVLIELAKEFHIYETGLEEKLFNEEEFDALRTEAKEWSTRGVTGVPCFFINDVQTFSGAQSEDSFLKVFDLVSEKFPLENDDQSNF